MSSVVGAPGPEPASAAPRSATLEDVARLAGVSLATASRVLNGSTHRVSDAYRERVEAASARLRYTPNRSAQATVRGTTDMVALLVADIADPYFAQIAAGVARGADEANLYMTIATTDRDPEREWRLLRALRGQRPRSVILAASRTTGAPPQEFSDEVDAITETGGKVVALGAGAPGLASVTVDNRGGARMLGRALFRRGYRRAVMIGAEPGVRTSDDRLDGFSDAFRAHGGEILHTRHARFTRAGGAEAMRGLLEDGLDRGTLVFGASDIVAMGAVTAARYVGRVIGSDIAVAGFDDIPAAGDVTPGLTTVRLPLEEIGYRALRRATGDDVAAPATRLEVVLRESTPEI